MRRPTMTHDDRSRRYRNDDTAPRTIHKEVRGHEATLFAQDLEWDSLTVLDFVANIEDEFDILITMNQQAEIETVGQLIDAVVQLKAG